MNLLNTILWPDETGNIMELMPKPQYDDEHGPHQLDTSYGRSTAKSFRLRNNIFNRIDQTSPKGHEQKAQLGRISRRKSVREGTEQTPTMPEDLSRKAMNDATERLVGISAKQIVLKPPLSRKVPTVVREADR